MRSFLLPLLLLATCVISGQPTVILEPLPMTFNSPTDLVGDPANSREIYVVEKGGLVNRYSLEDSTAAIVLDLTSRVATNSEGGLLGMAFHPAYPDSNYVYVNYTGPGSNGSALTTYVSRFPLDNAGIGIPLEEVILLTLEQPAANHNAGDLAFGPDGYLYIPTGDGGGADDRFRTAQDPGSLLGKLLRIDVDTATAGRQYAIPADNPFVGSTDTLEEIWALGLRNPWRISFDRESGELWIGDVGQGAREEVNFVPAGSPGGMNFGWNCREGLIAGPATDPGCGDADYTDPIVDYPHSGNEGINGKSITGGYVYRGPVTELEGYYVFADFVSPRLFLLDTEQLVDEEPELQVYSDLQAQSVSTFGEGADGSLYLADFGGTIYRVSVEGSTAVREPASASERLSVFPNPANSAVTFELPEPLNGEASANLTGPQGRSLGEWGRVMVSQGRGQLRLPGNLPRGTYWLNVTIDGHRWVSQVARE